MTDNKLEQILSDQINIIRSKLTGIERNYDFEKLITTNQIVVLTGIRRSGKSTLLLQLAQKFDNFYYINFDDERLINFTVEDFQTLMLTFKKLYPSKVIFIDEIQNIDKWERFIRRIFEEDFKIFVTGSNAKLLSSDLATHLTGRYIKRELYPFSFGELLKMRNIDSSAQDSDNTARILAAFDEYIINGGFPEYLKTNDKEYLSQLYNDILYRDLLVKFSIRNVKAFKNLSLYLQTNITNEFSYHALTKTLNVSSVNSIKDYTDYLQQSYLVFECPKYDYSLKKQYVSNKKIYSIDNGLRNTVAFRFNTGQGHLLENLVFIELKRRGYEVFYFKTKNNLEVDFVCQHENQLNLIQVSYSLADYNTRKREINSLTTAMNELNCEMATVLTYSETETINDNNKQIDVIPVWRWLLSEYSQL